jgi:acetate kinase
MWLFYPDPPFLRWCKVVRGRFSQDKIKFNPDCFDAVLKKIEGQEPVEFIGTLLYNGGEEIVEPVAPIDRDMIDKARKCVKFLPEHNDISVKTMETWLRRFPRARHRLLCDTAFFSGLPPESSTYAVPYSLRKDGIKRYGGYGFCHQSAWELARTRFGGAAHGILSIYLGDSTNITAIRDGRPVETSIGFTSIEGIPSSTGCGDIDPTIVLQLSSTGMSSKDIHLLLTKESGMTGLLGKGCGYGDLSDDKRDRAVNQVRKMFIYQIVKYCGAFISVSGGIDAVVFSAGNIEGSMNVIREICSRLRFLGLGLKEPAGKKDVFIDLTGIGSKIRTAALKFDRWKVLSEMVVQFNP